MELKTITLGTVDIFNKECNQLLIDGWLPYGNIFIVMGEHGSWYSQQFSKTLKADA